MRVKFRTTVSDGAGRRFASGQVAEVDDKQAKVWLGHGLVEQASEKRDATTRAPRTAEKQDAPKTTSEVLEENKPGKSEKKAPAKKAPRKRAAKKSASKKG